MKTSIIHISEKIQFENTLKTALSFKKFIEFLQINVRDRQSVKTPYFKWIIKKFEKLPELSGTIDLEKVGIYEEMLELISTCLLPLASDETNLWALGNPLSP